MEQFATKCDGFQQFKLFQKRSRYEEDNKDALLHGLASLLSPIGHTCFSAGTAAPGEGPGKMLKHIETVTFETICRFTFTAALYLSKWILYMY